MWCLLLFCHWIHGSYSAKWWGWTKWPAGSLSPGHLIFVVKTRVLALGPDRTVCFTLPNWKCNQQSLTHHPHLDWGLMRGHLETSLGGIHLGLITFLFTVFSLWRQTRTLTLGDNNRSMHTIPTHLPNYPQPSCRGRWWRNPHTQTGNTHVRAHTHTRTLSPPCSVQCRWDSELPSLSEMRDQPSPCRW